MRAQLRDCLTIRRCLYLSFAAVRVHHAVLLLDAQGLGSTLIITGPLS